MADKKKPDPPKKAADTPAKNQPLHPPGFIPPPYLPFGAPPMFPYPGPMMMPSMPMMPPMMQAPMMYPQPMMPPMQPIYQVQPVQQQPVAVQAQPQPPKTQTQTAPATTSPHIMQPVPPTFAQHQPMPGLEPPRSQYVQYPVQQMRDTFQALAQPQGPVAPVSKYSSPSKMVAFSQGPSNSTQGGQMNPSASGPPPSWLVSSPQENLIGPSKTMIFPSNEQIWRPL